MNLTLEEIVSKIASQGKNPDVSFLKDNPEAQAMLLLAILSSTKSKPPERSPSVTSNKVESMPKKVGRKPVTSEDEDSDNPKSKRKAQNRAAQRAFRERKENQVRILKDKVKELEDSSVEKNKKLILENQQLKDMIQRLQEENASLLGSTVSFDVPLSSINGDKRPQKMKRQNIDSTDVDSLSSYRSITIEDDLLNNTQLPSSALVDHSELLGLHNTKIDFSTSQLGSILQQQQPFHFETDPSQFDFFYPLSSSEASSSPSDIHEIQDITQAWDELPHDDEFNIDVLCDDMDKKAVCSDKLDKET